MYDVVILTESRYENPKIIDWYIQQVLTEDQLLKSSLEKLGLKVIRKNWLSKDFNWKQARCLIFRSTWDYFNRFDEFFKWVEETQTVTKFINSSEIINWNIDKYYLFELHKLGINIAPTNFIRKNNCKLLSSIMEKEKWSEAVLKPTISGAARHTYRVNLGNIDRMQKILNNLNLKEDMIVQEFLTDIMNRGEISLIMIGGEFTHAIRKIGKENDFRVQDDHGGRTEKHQATSEEISFAKKVITACPYDPLYARVDIIYDNNGNPSLSELELIEPELWFRNNPKSAEKLSEKILEFLN